MQFTIQNQVEFIAKLKKLKLFMSSEETRYYLMGVYFHLIDNKLHAVATDGHRLLRLDFAVAPDDGRDGETLSAIVPADAIKSLIAIKKPDSDLPLTIDFSNTEAKFDFLTIKLITKLVDGTFPDYTKVMPETAETKSSWALNSRYLKEALSVFGNDGVQFHYSNSENNEADPVTIKGHGDDMVAVLMPRRL